MTIRKAQRILKWFLPTYLILAILFAAYQSSPSDIIVIDSTKNREEVIKEMYKDGYFKNIFTYNLSLLISKFRGDVEPGGYSMKKMFGALVVNSVLDNPDYQYFEVEPGLRKEEVANQLALKLDWGEEKVDKFINDKPICSFSGYEGILSSGSYLIHKEDDPSNVREKMYERYIGEVTDIENTNKESILNSYQTTIIASMIQREAAGKGDMRLISGIIWNRIFNNMPLQIDATLQYIKGNEEAWWPIVRSEDKYLDSSYNTYQIVGLPPSPISTISKDAFLAAMNPIDTECLFYLHDRNRNIHCTRTYEAHKRNVSYYLK